MNRFQNADRPSGSVKKIFPVLIFCIVILIFLTGISSVSETTSRKEAESLEETIRKSAVHCYALEGFYPEDLEYLKTNYGLTYDREKYVVSYEIVGANMMPDVLVIPLGGKGGNS